MARTHYKNGGRKSKKKVIEAKEVGKREEKDAKRRRQRGVESKMNKLLGGDETVGEKGMEEEMEGSSKLTLITLHWQVESI